MTTLALLALAFATIIAVGSAAVWAYDGIESWLAAKTLTAQRLAGRTLAGRTPASGGFSRMRLVPVGTPRRTVRTLPTATVATLAARSMPVGARPLRVERLNVWRIAKRSGTNFETR